jgi:argininosuccinate lyase
MPGYTHLQRAQPIFFAHYLLGQIEAFARDVDRLQDCLRRTDVLPLGSGALAGSTIVLNREAIAQELGFAQVSQNSLDAVGDRDFVCEFVFSLALIGMHLSRLSEDLVIWSTSEFGFVEFSDSFSTGSSLMPQKKNPDMAELARGKTGRLYGNLISVLTTLKGLPSSYNRDLQEDKEALFDSIDTVRAALEVFSAMIPVLRIHRSRMEAAADDPALLATDLAEYLVGKGLPFRQAHEIVGAFVARAAEMSLPLNELPPEEMRKISPFSREELTRIFDNRQSLAKRSATGAPAPENVAARIQHWRDHFEVGR